MAIIKNKAITSRNDDFARWYTDIIKNAKLASYTSVKGCIVFEPLSYAIWENIQKELNKEFKETGHSNVYMPMFIPESLLTKESEHVKGFAPEVAWVTHGGNNKLEERLCVRPTSETLFCEYYSNIVKSYRDLPKLYNQWCSVCRWEKETRPFLRTREFLWQEGHTVHETAKEAEEETLRMLKIYEKFFKDFLAIPALIGKKTEKEKFAGAEYTYTIEALMYNGVSLQSGTTHYFGQKFSKPFDIKFLNRENKWENAYQTSWGVSTRILGAIIMVHGDDNGLVLPPRIAPTQVVIVPIRDDEKIIAAANKLKSELISNGIRVLLDDEKDKSAGFKFAEYEMQGVPIRIEIGPRDLENNQIVAVRRDNYEKIVIVNDKNIVSKISNILDSIHNEMYNKALRRNKELTFCAKTLDEVERIIKTQPGYIKAMWCGDQECEEKMKEIGGIKSRCIPFDEEQISDKCVVCGKPAKHMVVWGIQY